MKKPIIKDKNASDYVDYLESKLKRFEESPLVNSYLSLHQTIENWNRQLNENEIDIFDEDAKPKFEMAHKYLTEQKPYIEQLEYLRKLMTPEQQKQLGEELKHKNLGMAEKIALNGK